MKLDGREINCILGQNIRMKRKQAGLSQKDLADAVSELSDCIVSASMVSSWERGDSFVPASMVHCICVALHCSSYELFPHSAIASDQDIEVHTIVKTMSPRAKEILLYMVRDWKGDADTLWEFGALYAVLPEYRREYIARTGIECYKEGIHDKDENIDKRIEVNLPQIVRGWQKLDK